MFIPIHNWKDSTEELPKIVIIVGFRVGFILKSAENIL